MKITFLAVGKIKFDFFAAAQKKYFAQISRFCDFEIVEIPDEKRKLPPEKLKKIEAEKIAKKIAKNDFVIFLDENGREFSAENFAKFLENLENLGRKIIFVVGGNFGFDADFLKIADAKIALSKMTLTADLARIVFLENLFRGFSIWRKIPFHK